jgi:hypothetical protein
MKPSRPGIVYLIGQMADCFGRRGHVTAFLTRSLMILT